METKEVSFTFDFKVPKVVVPFKIIGEVLQDYLLFEEIDTIDNKKITEHIHKKLSNKMPKIKNFKFEVTYTGSNYLDTLYGIYLFNVKIDYI